MWPTTTPDAVRRKLEDEYGAEVIVEGSDVGRGERKGKALAGEYRRLLVHPFEGETTWKGHSTLVQEVDAQLAALGLRMDAIVVVLVEVVYWLACCEALVIEIIAIVAAETVARTVRAIISAGNAGDDPYYLNRRASAARRRRLY